MKLGKQFKLKFITTCKIDNVLLVLITCSVYRRCILNGILVNVLGKGRFTRVLWSVDSRRRMYLERKLSLYRWCVAGIASS